MSESSRAAERTMSAEIERLRAAAHVHPVSRSRALIIGVWLGWGVDSIATHFWPSLTGHTLRLGVRDLIIATLIWGFAFLKDRRWMTQDEFRRLLDARR